MKTFIKIAASNSDEDKKSQADYICTGSGDEAVLNEAIETLVHGGTVQLLDGDYYIDSFSSEDHSAVFFGYNNGIARAIKIVGDTTNKSYNTYFGVCIHVTEKALNSLQKGEQGHVFYATSKCPQAEGCYYTFTHVNDVSFDNFYLFLANVSHPVVGIDGTNMGAIHIRQVGIYHKSYFDDRYLHQKPATPCQGVIGIQSTHGANDGIPKVGIDTVEVGGLYIGIHMCGMDHVIMNNASACRCCYGYVFEQSYKTLTMINCDDEGNTHLPLFRGTGHLTCLDFNIERFETSPIPDDIDGYNQPYAEEEVPGSWKGFISYTIEGNALGKHSLWNDGHGINFKTINLSHELVKRSDAPELYENYFDRESNKTLTWNGNMWVDAMGNPEP